MISVAISINGTPIIASAVRVKDNSDGNSIYSVDEGSKITHNPDDGAVKLAIKMLKTVKEAKK